MRDIFCIFGMIYFCDFGLIFDELFLTGAMPKSLGPCTGGQFWGVF